MMKLWDKKNQIINGIRLLSFFSSDPKFHSFPFFFFLKMHLFIGARESMCTQVERGRGRDRISSGCNAECRARP